jgi:hypothetical protein
MTTDTKTIHEFLAENPNVDVSKAWERCFGILGGIKDRIGGRLPVERHPECAGREYYTSPDKAFEGSFNAYTGRGVEWLVHSWLGNRKASILDMNATCFLGQETDTPHLIVIFGTIPKLFFYADYVPRRDLRTDTDYLDRYYGGEVNEDFLKLRGNPAFHWSVSHGTYMRALLSPVGLSIAGELNDANIDTLEAYAQRFVSRWLGWLDKPQTVPASERAALQKYDHRVRALGYQRDPMNKLAVNVFGADQVENMIRMRMGAAQMQASRMYAP